MMSGIKLTLLLPTVDNLLRKVVTSVANEKSDAQYILILCHSTMRCTEIEEFCRKLTTFC